MLKPRKGKGPDAPHRPSDPGHGPEIRASFVDCDGPSLRLRTTLGGKLVEGWITPDGRTEKVCASQRTTCV